MERTVTRNGKRKIIVKPDKTQDEFLVLCISLHKGGTERQISYLTKLPTCVGIVSLETPEPFFDTGRLKVTALSNQKRNTPGWKKWLLFPVLLVRLINLIRRHKNIAVVSFLDRANLLNVAARLVCRHTCIVSIRTDIVDFYSGSYAKKLLLRMHSFFYRRASVVVFNSRAVAERYQNYLGEKLLRKRIVSNAFPVAEIKAKAADSVQKNLDDLFAQKSIVITVGNTHVYKGHWFLLRIFRELKTHTHEPGLMIVGDGDLYRPLVKLAKELGLRVFDAKKQQPLTPQYDVYFMGQQQNPFALVRRAKIFAFSSVLEGSPNVLNEALICGKTVVAADCNSGPREILVPAATTMQTLHYPVETKLGTLMPPFKDGAEWENPALSEEERLWVRVLAAKLDERAAEGPDRAYLDAHLAKLEEADVLQKWQQLINQE